MAWKEPTDFTQYNGGYKPVDLSNMNVNDRSDEYWAAVRDYYMNKYGDDFAAMQAAMARDGYVPKGSLADYLQNGLDNASMQRSQDWEQLMRDTSYTSVASQLQSLGLNPASVVDTGGANVGTPRPAEQTTGNARAAAEMENNKRIAVARNIMNLLGAAAGAGIHGAAMAGAKSAAANIASNATKDAAKIYARSRMDIRRKTIDPEGEDLDWDAMLKEIESL